MMKYHIESAPAQPLEEGDAETLNHAPDAEPDHALLVEYHQHHEGVTRGVLPHVNRKLYDDLRAAGLLKYIQTQRTLDYTPEEVLAECRKDYDGVTRGRLAKLNNALYNRARRTKVLEQLPLAPKNARRLREEQRSQREIWRNFSSRFNIE